MLRPHRRQLSGWRRDLPGRRAVSACRVVWQPPCSSGNLLAQDMRGFVQIAAFAAQWARPPRGNSTERSTVMSEAPTNEQAKKNEGEGNRTADRKYREGVRRHVESGAPKPAGEEAQHALEGAEAEELRRAEEAAKAGRKK